MNDGYSLCVSSLKFMNCQFNFVPIVSFTRCTGLTHFDISNSSVTTLTDVDFQDMINLKHLNLSFNKIQAIPENYFAYGLSLIFLDLSNNQISSFNSNLFRNISNLEILNLSFNQIKTLDVGLFRYMKNLNQLHLTDNQLKVVCLQYFNSVGNLFLQNNKITEFVILESDDEDIFDFINLSNNLMIEFNAGNSNIKNIQIENNRVENFNLNENVITFLAKNNKITRLNLTNLINLEILDLSNNQVGKSIKIKSFLKLGNLKELYLKNTELKIIQKETFPQHIRILDISYNNLGKIDFQNFDEIKGLEKMYIDGNDLTTIDYKNIQDIFPNLKLIGISNNKWDCIYLILLLKKMNSLNIEIHADSNIYASNSPLQNGISCDGEVNVKSPINVDNNEDETILLFEKVFRELDRISELYNDEDFNTEPDLIEATTIFNEVGRKKMPEKDRSKESVLGESNIKLTVQNILLLLIFLLGLIFVVFKIMKSCFSSARNEGGDNFTTFRFKNCV